MQILDLLFPRNCLHCNDRIKGSSLLCDGCGPLLELLPVDLSSKNGAALPYYGPAASIVTALKYGNRPTLARGCAAFMLAQFERLGWPRPDRIVPVPQHWLGKLKRGYNQSALLAEELSRLLDRPLANSLRKRIGGFAQASLSAEQRRALDEETFFLKEGQSFEGETLLLVDDVTTTGTTLKHCTRALEEGFPKQIYTLTLCQSD